MISVYVSGSFKKTTDFLDKLRRGDIYDALNRYGQLGVQALSQATPEETGDTAISWSYRVRRVRKGFRIEWLNSHVDDAGTPIAILIQYGHATGTGGYVLPQDFINPAMKPVFEYIADDVWKKVNL